MLVGCPLLLILVVLVVLPDASWFVWFIASCLLVVSVLVVCAFDAWLSLFVASFGGSHLLDCYLCCVSFVVVGVSGLLLLVCGFSSDVCCWLCFPCWCVCLCLLCSLLLLGLYVLLLLAFFILF